jgi:hypothetical protein
MINEGSSMTIVEVPLDLVDFDGRRARGDTESYIYSDLLFFYSLGDSSLGAVGAELAGSRVLVRSRARYAAIAEDLGLDTIECLFPAQASLEDLLERPGVRVSGAAEGAEAVPTPGMEWHVIGFDRPPSEEEVTRLAQLMSEVFADPAHPAVEVARAGVDPALLYFRTWTPHDRESSIRLLSALQSYDHDVVPVRSYRGGRFRHQLQSLA